MEREVIYRLSWESFVDRVEYWANWRDLDWEQDPKQVRVYAPKQRRRERGDPIFVADMLQPLRGGGTRLHVHSVDEAQDASKLWKELKDEKDIEKEQEVTFRDIVWIFPEGWEIFAKVWKTAAKQAGLRCWDEPKIPEIDALTIETPTGRRATLTGELTGDGRTRLTWQVAAHDWEAMYRKDGKVAATVGTLRGLGFKVDTGDQAGDQTTAPVVTISAVDVDWPDEPPAPPTDPRFWEWTHRGGRWNRPNMKALGELTGYAPDYLSNMHGEHCPVCGN